MTASLDEVEVLFSQHKIDNLDLKACKTKEIVGGRLQEGEAEDT